MFFKKENNENNDLSKVAALLIHAAKIDENFSKSEEAIIKQALLQIGAKSENLEKTNNFCEECKKEDESVRQNLIMHGYKICKSCNLAKTIFPI